MLEVYMSVLVCCGSHQQFNEKEFVKGKVDIVVKNLKAHYHIKIDPAVFKRWEVKV